MPKKYPPEVRARALSLFFSGMSATEVSEHLAVEYDAGVDVRAVQRWVKPFRDAGRPWTLADAVDDEARLILPVLGEVLAKSGPTRPALTTRQAAWVVRVRRAVPDLPPWEAYVFALEYGRCAVKKRPTTHLDAALACRPWESAERARNFKRDGERWGLEEIVLIGAPKEIIDEGLQELFGEPVKAGIVRKSTRKGSESWPNALTMKDPFSSGPTAAGSRRSASDASAASSGERAQSQKRARAPRES